jgi:hypothetical protein
MNSNLCEIWKFLHIWIQSEIRKEIKGHMGRIRWRPARTGTTRHCAAHGHSCPCLHGGPHGTGARAQPGANSVVVWHAVRYGWRRCSDYSAWRWCSSSGKRTPARQCSSVAQAGEASPVLEGKRQGRLNLMRTSLRRIQSSLLSSCKDKLWDHDHNNYVVG